MLDKPVSEEMPVLCQHGTRSAQPSSLLLLSPSDGRRFVSEDNNRVLKQGLQGWYAVLKGKVLLHVLMTD